MVLAYYLHMHSLLVNTPYNLLYTLGEKMCTMNVHILAHLTDCVRCWGPLWAYSCFPFETRNGDIKKMFHGSRDMTKQVQVLHDSDILGMFYLSSTTVQMAFSYVMTQLLPQLYNENPIGRVQAVANVLLGRKR